MSAARDLHLVKRPPVRTDLILQATKFCCGARPVDDQAELGRAAVAYIASLPAAAGNFQDDAGRPVTLRLARAAEIAAQVSRYDVKAHVAVIWDLLEEATKEPPPNWQSKAG